MVGEITLRDFINEFFFSRSLFDRIRILLVRDIWNVNLTMISCFTVKSKFGNVFPDLKCLALHTNKVKDRVLNVCDQIPFPFSFCLFPYLGVIDELRNTKPKWRRFGLKYIFQSKIFREVNGSNWTLSDLP